MGAPLEPGVAAPVDNVNVHPTGSINLPSQLATVSEEILPGLVVIGDAVTITSVSSVAITAYLYMTDGAEPLQPLRYAAVTLLGTALLIQHLAVAGAYRLERLHKYLASTGAGSRRECETFIEQGRVAVNGKVVTRQGVKVDPAKDKVTLDGEQVKVEDRVYYLLHKPPGFISTNSDEMGRPRVVDLVHDDAHRIYTVGRLDADSAGLILLTNDGAIANLVCHPRYRIEKTYQVVVRGEVDREQLAKVEAGVWLAEGKSSPARVRARAA